MKVHFAKAGQPDGTFHNSLSCSNYRRSQAGIVTTDWTKVTCAKCKALALASATVVDYDAAVVPELADIERRLAAAGFRREGMGGNCEAFVRRSVDGIEELITDDDASIPTSLSQQCYVANYSDGDCCDVLELTVTVRDVLDALERTDDEYSLLTLKIRNRR